jgi:hypothetical protein
MLTVGVAVLTVVACNRRTQPQQASESRPASAPHTATSPEEAPATQPATRQREELPASTFDTHPPYTVQLYVRKPEDKQPGWLRVLALQDKDSVARAQGVFPRQNIIEVNTENIHQIQVELGYLPLAEGKRVVLRIDGQGIEITQRDRRFITLERRPTGRWEVRKTQE